ncbi:arylsulfatase A-like enzyme [Jejuia pallidilutea]|uniref:Arylsulfatase A-like enzyme n=1 Tax=Jejuia pallidilutea TaxID=504487 RepID=A0A362WZQ3_9FLAO|nr:sulfatase [Jejuia pallidilutea]PQV48227.1 arylsulfatase A-like enzyme [Jejuia pallidilutea]
MKNLLYFFLLTFTVVHAQDKPNILWITIEDTSPQFIGCYGNKDASTPVIDKLAEQGIRFTNAFSTGTVCSPSRSTIITGVPTFKMGTGNHRSNYPIPDFIHGFPDYLQQQGYYTSNNVKTDYNIANEKDFIKEAWNESSRTASWRGRSKEQPFFSVFNFAESHQSRTMSMSFDWYVKNVWNYLPEDDKIADDAFEMPPFYNDTPEMRKQFARVYNSIKLTDNRIGELLEKLDKDGLRDNTIIFFYADHGEGMPRGKTNGINLGYRVPFIVWFPEKYKHLSPWGEAGSVTDELISFEDLAPTMISLAGGKVPDYLNGRILIGENRSQPKDYLLLSSDRADNGPDLVRTITDGRFVYSRNFMPFMPEMRYIRYIEIADITKHMRSDFKLKKLNTLQEKIFKTRPHEVLYDVENDIWETNNLVYNSEYNAILKKMRNQLDTKVLQARDILFAPEYEIGLISKNQTPYLYRLDDAKYPFQDIYNVASLSGLKSKKTAKEQIKLLKSKNEIVRYWAAVGLMSQNKTTLESFKNKLMVALHDKYPPVAITVAAIVHENFKTEESTQLLKQYCKSDNMDLALMTINYLLYVDDKAPFIETIKKVHDMPNRNYNVKAGCMDFLGILNIVENTSKTEN